jgi:hypothetical protein
MGSADPPLSSFADPSGALAGVLLMGDCRSAAFTDLLATAAPAHADWLFDRFTTQPQVAGQSYDKTYSGGGWARYGRPPFSRRMR